MDEFMVAASMSMATTQHGKNIMMEYEERC